MWCIARKKKYIILISFGFCQNSRLGGSSEEGVIHFQQVK